MEPCFVYVISYPAFFNCPPWYLAILGDEITRSTVYNFSNYHWIPEIWYSSPQIWRFPRHLRFLIHLFWNQAMHSSLKGPTTCFQIRTYQPWVEVKTITYPALMIITQLKISKNRLIDNTTPTQPMPLFCNGDQASSYRKGLLRPGRDRATRAMR